MKADGKPLAVDGVGGGPPVYISAVEQDILDQKVVVCGHMCNLSWCIEQWHRTNRTSKASSPLSCFPPRRLIMYEWNESLPINAMDKGCTRVLTHRDGHVPDIHLRAVPWIRIGQGG